MKSIQMRARSVGVPAGAGGKLDIQEHHTLNLIEQGADILGSKLAQILNLGGESVQTAQTFNTQTAPGFGVIRRVNGVTGLIRCGKMLDRFNKRTVFGEVFHSVFTGPLKFFVGGTQTGIGISLRARWYISARLLRGLLAKGSSHIFLARGRQVIRPISQRKQIRCAQPPTCASEQTHQGI